jgi:hypothetical protein
MAKAAVNKKRAVCTGKMDWEMRKTLVKCYEGRLKSFKTEFLYSESDDPTGPTIFFQSNVLHIDCVMWF